MPSTRYAGKLAGLYPTDPFQALLCDEVMYVVEEASVKLGPTFRMTGEEQKAARLELVNGSYAGVPALAAKPVAGPRRRIFCRQPPDHGRPESVCRHTRTQLGTPGPCARPIWWKKWHPLLNAHMQRIAQTPAVAQYYAKFGL
jgi:glutathione S-transferase